MKKLLSLMLVLCMMLSVGAAMAETAEVTEASYATFEEHFYAFAGGLDANNQDVNIALISPTAQLRLTAGTNADGVQGFTLYQNDQAMGGLQWDKEAVYLNVNGQAMCIKLATIQELFNLEGLRNDLQQVVGLAQMLVMNLTEAFVTSQEENVMILTLDSEKFAEGLATGIDQILASGTFAELVNKYAAYLGIEITPEMIAEQWAAKRAEAVETFRNIEATVKVDNSTGKINVNAVCKNPENAEEQITLSGDISMTAGIDAAFVMTANMNGQDMRVDYTIKNTGNSVEVSEKVAMNNEVVEEIYEAVDLGPNGMPTAFLYTIAMQGNEVMRVQYKDGTFTLVSNGTEVLSAYIEDQKLYVVLGNGQQAVAEITENDADHIKAVVTLKQGEQSQQFEIVAEMVQGDNGEYFKCSLYSNEMEFGRVQMYGSEPQGFESISSMEGIQEITPEMIRQLVQNALRSAFASF